MSTSIRDFKSHYVGLANPTRLAIIALLVDGKMTASDLARRLKLSQPLLSWHLRVMRRAGLVSTVRAGREVHVAINHKSIHEYQRRFNQFIGQPSAAAIAAPSAAPHEPGLETPGMKEIVNAI